MRIIMLGAPGAGKGTQAKKIAAHYNLPHISTGEILRAIIKEGTEEGLKAKEYLDKGLLVPDEFAFQLLVERISEDDAKNGYVLDGFPRTIPQAEALTDLLEKRNEKIDFVFDIEVPDENIINRMAGRRVCTDCGSTYHLLFAAPEKENLCDKCGGELILREDDKPETVKRRLDVYHTITKPLIDYYNAHGVLHEIDGTMEINEIFAMIRQIVGE